MSWKKQAGTKHSPTCRMAFGHKDPTCPRCQELLAGSAPREWASHRSNDDARRTAEIDAHFRSEHHKSGKCGPICTFGDY